MKVYRATITDKCANPSGEEPMSYESYVAVATLEELKEGGVRERAGFYQPHIQTRTYIFTLTETTGMTRSRLVIL